MPSNRSFRIAVFKGDGIGQEVIDSALAVIGAALARVGAPPLVLDELQAGAAYYRATGLDISDDTFDRAEAADAILLGAMGLPSVCYPEGTEISPHLKMRDRFGLFAGVRPVKAFPNVPRYLADPRAADIDLVILRESTEGLFHTQGRGEVIGDQEARETLRITRAVCEPLFDMAFDIARRRALQRDKPPHVTCVDKANVFRAFAFFRKIFDERAALNKDVTISHAYVDAQALFLVRRPWEFDVLVMENMFGDILSDLAGGLVGGMGLAPCAEIGKRHGLFQPAHGSAPDIAGQDKANPIAAILSAGMMLDWLSGRHGVEKLQEASSLIQAGVEKGFASRRIHPIELGGRQGCRDVTRAVLEIVND